MLRCQAHVVGVCQPVAPLAPSRCKRCRYEWSSEFDPAARHLDLVDGDNAGGVRLYSTARSAGRLAAHRENRCIEAECGSAVQHYDFRGHGHQ
jgi:hypothetical protein